MDKILEVKNLHTSFFTRAGEVKAVRGVNFDLEKGEALGIVGESGSGKSVTSLSILRLLASMGKVVDGQIIFDGQDLAELTPKEIRDIRGSKISMIFQDPMSSLNPLITVGKQVAEMIYTHEKISKDELKTRVLELLELVKIPEAEKRYNAYPHEFSGGMRQRVMIAMALACNPELVIADEPTTALDVTIQDQILKLLRQLQKDRNMAIIFITHDLGVVAEICSRIAVMYGGMIMETGSAEEIFKNPSHPYTMGLLKSMPSITQDRSKKLEPIDGSPPNMLKPPAGCPFAARCDYARNICDEAKPEYYEISDRHISMCWLLDEKAPKENNPFQK